MENLRKPAASATAGGSPALPNSIVGLRSVIRRADLCLV